MTHETLPRLWRSRPWSKNRILFTLPDGRSLNEAAFDALTAQLAHMLRALGVQKGDRVAAQVEKSPEALGLYVACLRAGAVYLPLNTAYTTTEIEYFVTDAEPCLVVCDPRQEKALETIAARIGARTMTLGARGEGSLLALAENQPPVFDDAAVTEADLAAILYTSGTTGRAKGAMLTHENLASNATTLRDIWRFNADDILLHALPIYHAHGLFIAVNVTLLAGASMLFLPLFRLDDVLAWLPRATTMMGVPTFYTRLLDDPRFSGDLVQHVRLFVSGSAPLLASTHQSFQERTGHRILERYGMTETGMNTSNPYDGPRKPGTVGLPLPSVEVRVTDLETGSVLPMGAVGMIEVRGPNVFKGYWRQPEKTVREFRADGYFITGDLGEFDANGYLRIVGRSKDLIITGGFNVYPKEIELAIDAMGEVDESAVIGVPHPDLGEGVVAVIVPKRGSSLCREQVLQALTASLARFKIPRAIILADELPRNTMGKVLKSQLRDRHVLLFQRSHRQSHA